MFCDEAPHGGTWNIWRDWDKAWRWLHPRKNKFDLLDLLRRSRWLLLRQKIFTFGKRLRTIFFGAITGKRLWECSALQLYIAGTRYVLIFHHEKCLEHTSIIHYSWTLGNVATYHLVVHFFLLEKNQKNKQQMNHSNVHNNNSPLSFWQSEKCTTHGIRPWLHSQLLVLAWCWWYHSTQKSLLLFHH